MLHFGLQPWTSGNAIAFSLEPTTSAGLDSELSFPASEMSAGAWRSGTFRLWLLGEASFVPGDSAASGNRISILWPEKEAVFVIHGDQQIETKWPMQKTSRCQADVGQTRSSGERKQKNHQGNFKCFPSICQAKTSFPFQRETIVGTGFLAFCDWGE